MMARLRPFLAWWLAELAAMVPPMLLARRGRGRLVVSLAAAEAVVTREGGGNVTPLGVATDRHELARLLAETGAPVVLRLPDGRALWRMVSLPSAAEGNLRQVLGFEMDRQTPWLNSDVVFDCRVAARDAARRRIDIEMLVAPRAVVEDALHLAAGWGITPDAVDAATPSGAAFDLSPPGSRRRRDWVARAAAALAGLALVGAVAAALVGIDRRTDAAGALEAEVAALKDRAEAALHLRAEIERLDAEARLLAGHKQARPPVVALLDELTRVLPDGTWVGQLELGGGEIEVTGWSPSASDVARRLEEAASFRRAEFRSPVVQDPRQGLERFHVAARLAGGRP